MLGIFCPLPNFRGNWRSYLDLPPNAKIHNVMLESLLKPHFGPPLSILYLLKLLTRIQSLKHLQFLIGNGLMMLMDQNSRSSSSGLGFTLKKPRRKATIILNDLDLEEILMPLPPWGNFNAPLFYFLSICIPNCHCTSLYWVSTWY